MTKKKTFRTPVRFSVPDSKVTEENLPSAEDLEKLLPTLEELESSLPTAKALKKQYHVGEELRFGGGDDSSTSGAATTTTAQSANKKEAMEGGGNEESSPKPLWPDADTPQEILEEEMYGRSDVDKDGKKLEEPIVSTSRKTTSGAGGGGETEEPAQHQPEHVALAWRALMYGTLLATAGVGLLTVVLGYGVFGVTGLGDVRRRMREKEDADVTKMREQMEQQTRRKLQNGDGTVVDFTDSNNNEDRVNGGGETVQHFTLDLTNPAELPKQITEIWTAIQTLVEEEGKKAELLEEAEKQRK